MNKISYDDYFLCMTYLVAMRSIDPSTKCGAVLVSKEHKVLRTGYNGPLKGADDKMIPLERPFKYPHSLHAEENCLLAYNGSNQDLEDSTMYVTIRPCHKCLRMIIQKGITNIVYTNGNLAVMQDKEEDAVITLMLSYCKPINIRSVNNLSQINQLLVTTQDYIKSKNQNSI